MKIEYKLIIDEEEYFELSLNERVRDGWNVAGDIHYSQDSDGVDYITILLWREIKDDND